MKKDSTPEGRGLDPLTKRLIGDHGTAEQVINWLLHVNRDTDTWNNMDFLKAWNEGNAAEDWPEFYHWLNEVHPANTTDPLAGSCFLCAGKCRGHSLVDEATWEPEPGSQADIATPEPRP